MLVLNQAVWAGSHERDETKTLLLMLAIGSVLFLTLIDPKLGMARDWDLMSLTMLAPILWLLGRLSESSPLLTSPKLIGTALLSLFITVCFVATNGITSASEARFNSIVTYYGTKDDTGSVILAYYYLNKGDLDKAQAITSAVAETNSRKADIFQLLGLINKKSGNLEAAANNFRSAIKAKPYQPRLKNELGQVYLAQGKPREALQVLQEAHHNDPRLTFVMEGIGLAYFRMGLVDSTTLIADSLFRQEPDSPGGHILRMIVAIQENDVERARLHYQAFLKIGSNRSDFKSIRESYRFLAP
jgi:tetratricopeptide (TPR) repeat protein